MHCYFDNLITIAKCFCKALRILQSNAQVWGAGPSSVFCSSVGVLCSPPKHNTDYLVFYQNWKEREDSQQLHFVLKAKARLPFATACSNYPPALAVCRWRGNRREEEGRKKKKSQQKTTLLQTRWEHSTWPNQSITSVGRRCSTAVEQHTISQSIGHKHMVTNQWHPEDLGGLSRALLVHAWWLHNHTSFHSLEDTNQHSNNLPWNLPRRAY